MSRMHVPDAPSIAVLRAGDAAGNAREHAADRAADGVLGMRPAPVPGRIATAGAGRRHVAGGPETAAFGGPGRPLGAADRGLMEGRLAADFSGVRVHADRAAVVSARALGAQALTVGQHVAFGAGAYAPGTQDGRHLLAHELEHVVQQDRSGATQVDRKVAADPTAATLGQADVDGLTDAELSSQIQLVRTFLAAHPGDAGVQANLALMERSAAQRRRTLPAAPSAPAAAAPAKRGPAALPPEVERSPAHQRMLAEVMQAHWPTAAELLNAYNAEGIRSVLAGLHARQVESLYLGAIAHARVGENAAVAIEALAASPELGKARQAALASGLTMREVVDYVTLTRGDVMDRYGLVRFWKIKELMRALPGSVLSHLLPAEDTTIYMHPSGRMGTIRDETANKVAEVRPPSGIGAVAGAATRLATDDPNIIGAVTAGGDLVETGLAGVAPRGYYKGVSAQGAPPANQPTLVVGPGGRSPAGPPPSPAAPAAPIPAIMPKGQAANDNAVGPPQAVPARQAAGAEGYEPVPTQASGSQKPPDSGKGPAPFFPPPGTKPQTPATPAPAAQPAAPAAAAPASTWTPDSVMTGRSQFQPTQRIVYRASVDAMAAAMRAGTFDWGGMDDPIMVDARGTLLQGHHRVIAARLAGVSIPQSAIRRVPGDSPRDPRPWSMVTVKPGAKP